MNEAVHIPRSANAYERRVNSIMLPLALMAQSAGAVEYTNCISIEEQDSSNECPVYDICEILVSLQPTYK